MGLKNSNSRNAEKGKCRCRYDAGDLITRIDQLYYKGRGLKNTSTKIVSSWPGGFPSDHFLIVSQFDLTY